MRYGTCGQRESIEKERDADDARCMKLIHVVLKAHQVYHPHGADKADGAEDAYRRKIFHRIHASTRQRGIGNGVCQCQRRHVKRQTQRVKTEQTAKCGFRAGRLAVICRS